MFSFLSGIGGKIMAGVAAAGVFILALMRLQSRARKDERNKIEGESAREENRIMKDANKERENVRNAGPDAARDRMRKRRNKRNG